MDIDTSRLKNEQRVMDVRRLETRTSALESAHQMLLEKLNGVEDLVMNSLKNKKEEKKTESVEEVIDEIKEQPIESDDDAPVVTELELMARTELKAEATALNIEFKNNIPTDKLIELIKTKQGE